MISDMDEFVHFCNEHTMKEIIEKYGIAGKNAVYRATPVISFKKAPKHLGEQSIKILDDVRSGMKQSDVARKYNVSRQYVSKLINMEINNG